MCTLLNLTKCSFTFRFANYKSSNFLAFAVFLFFFSFFALSFLICCWFCAIFRRRFLNSWLDLSCIGLLFIVFILFSIALISVIVIIRGSCGCVSDVPALNSNVIVPMLHIRWIISLIIMMFFLRQHVIFLYNNTIFSILCFTHYF